MPAKAHTGLCRAEKDELDRVVREMYEAVSALDNACRTVRVGDENYAKDFQTARKQLGVIRDETLVEKYIHNFGRLEYDEGKKALADGKTHMQNARERDEIEKTKYAFLVEKMKTCEEKMWAYEQAWSAIDKFDRLNKRSPSAARFAGYHAFNQKKAAMDEMRGLLGRLETLKCEPCI
jgi:hypothetical protein